MKAATLTFDGVDYPFTMIRIFPGTPEELYVNVSTTALQDVLFNKKTGEYTSPEAQHLDEHIAYYLEPEELSLSEEVVTHIVESVY